MTVWDENTVSACPNCGHDAHDDERCKGTSDEGRYACSCSWPNPDNFTD